MGKDVTIYKKDEEDFLRYHIKDKPTENARRIEARRNEPISWDCAIADSKWAIDFGNASPMEDYKYGDIDGGPKYGGRVRRSAGGKYKYFVAVLMRTKNGSYILTDDPEVDVDEDG